MFQKKILLGCLLLGLGSHHASAFVSWGIKGGLAPTRYTFLGSTPLKSQFGLGYTLGVAADFSVFGLGVETGLYYARREFQNKTASLSSDFATKSIELPFLAYTRFLGVLQAGAGLMYRRMFESLDYTSGGITLTRNHSEVGLKQDDLALLFQLGARAPLGLVTLTAELRAFWGLVDLGASETTATHSLGADLLVGVMF